MPKNSQKPRLLYVFGGEKAQGAEIVIERLMAYNAHRYDTHLILSPGNFADELLAANKPYQIHTLAALRKLNRQQTSSYAYYLRAASNYLGVSYHVYKYIKKRGIQIVHSNTLVPSAYLLPLVTLAKWVSKVKWLWSDHDMKYPSALENTLANQCVKHYDETLLVSKALKKKYKPNVKISVLYNGLDATQFKKDDDLRQAFRDQWKIGSDETVVTIAGSINPDKGQLELIRVFNKLCEQHTRLRLFIAGNYADQFPEYRTAIQHEIELNPNILYGGFITDTASLFNGCDIVVNNSNNTRSESLGTTIYEAMACEKLVVASATGGTPEIITDGVNGLLFEPDNEDELLQKLSYAVINLQILKEIKLAARQKVLDVFEISQMAIAYNAIISKYL